MAWRADALRRAGRFEESGRSLLAAAQLNLRSTEVRDVWGYVFTGVQREGMRLAASGDAAGALKLYDLAWEIQPRDAGLLDRRAGVVVGKEHPEVADLEAAIVAHPDDVALHQALDYALATARRFDRVVEMWTAFIVAHPDEGLPHLERSGAYFNLKNRREMLADATRACELGWLEGCKDAGE